MGDKLDQPLTEALAGADDPALEQTLPVIVTLRPGNDAASFSTNEMRIERAFESIAAVSGTVRLADLAKLEADERIEKIEFDGQMQALEQ